MYSPEMERIPCVIMRSGTSKGIYLLSNDLPEDPEPRDERLQFELPCDP